MKGLRLWWLSAALALPVQAAAEDMAERDPWEGFNRQMFAFNMTLDDYLVKPLAKGYRAVTPDPVEQGVDNAFANLRELTNVLNDALQWKWGQAANDSGRFLINTTLGLAGIFDVAGHFGLARGDGEDLGQTLAVWGLAEGPYMMLPLLGPSTLTRTLSLPADLDALAIGQIQDVALRNSLTGLRMVSLRAKLLPLEEKMEEGMSGDKYAFIRDIYLQNRAFLINDGQVEDDFGAGDDDYGGDY